MTPDEAVAYVLAALDAAAIPYMLVGSLASNFHGIPRSTRGADFVVQFSPQGLQRLAACLRSGLTLERQGAFEAVTGTIRHLVTLAGANRSKDRDDVRNIIAVQGPTLDWTYLDHWSAAHGTARLLFEIRASIPPV